VKVVDDGAGAATFYVQHPDEAPGHGVGYRLSEKGHNWRWPAPPPPPDQGGEPCGALRALENWQPTCDLPKGHEGPHRWNGPSLDTRIEASLRPPPAPQEATRDLEVVPAEFTEWAKLEGIRGCGCAGCKTGSHAWYARRDCTADTRQFALERGYKHGFLDGQDAPARRDRARDEALIERGRREAVEAVVAWLVDSDARHGGGLSRGCLEIKELEAGEWRRFLKGAR
jgi:hypothetical protein